MITPRQRDLRRKHLQASDVPAILGMSPWASEVDVYLAKKLPSEDISTEAMEQGNWLERPLVEHCCEVLNVHPCFRNTFRVEDGPGIIGANIDSFIMERPDEAIEAKKDGSMDDSWGDEGTDQIPQRVYVQVQIQMHVAVLRRVWVVMADHNLRRRIYPIDRNPEVIGELVKFGHDWWNRHVLADNCPTGNSTDIDTLRRVIRKEHKRTEIPRELVDVWQTAAKARANAQKAYDVAAANLLAAMGDAELANFGDDVQEVAYLQQNSQPTVNHTLMRLDGVWEKYCSTSKHRTLRLRKRGKDSHNG